jgi:hypothetical protein
MVFSFWFNNVALQQDRLPNWMSDADIQYGRID